MFYTDFPLGTEFRKFSFGANRTKGLESLGEHLQIKMLSLS
jgi:hypothetical protein